MEQMTNERLREMISAGGEDALGAHDVLAKRAKAEGLELSLKTVQEAVDLLRNNMRWEAEVCSMACASSRVCLL